MNIDHALIAVFGAFIIGFILGRLPRVADTTLAELRADRYSRAVDDLDKWCGHPFSEARIIAKHLKAHGEGLSIYAGTPCGEEPCTISGLREQLNRLNSKKESQQ